MKMKNFRKFFWSVVIGLLFFLATLPANQQYPGQFYNVDTEIVVEGIVEKIFFESRYSQKELFLLLLLKDAGGEKSFIVEVSPSWFFNYDLHRGEKVKIFGSYYQKDDQNYLLAREIQVGGEKIIVRDVHGFPYWRETRMMKRMRKRSPR